VNEEDVRKVRELGKIKIAAFLRDGRSDADILVVGKNSEGDRKAPLPSDFSKSRDLSLLKEIKVEKGAYVEISGKEYENFAINLAKYADHILVIGRDWKIIPLENLIAELQKIPVQIVSGAKDSSEARTAFETLEHGADAVLLDTDERSEIAKTLEIARRKMEPLSLSKARITKVKTVGSGDRVCIDTCSVLSTGEGVLVGSQASGFFLVHAEVEESPYVAPRPFRVNAGPVHAYILVGERTKYLSELEAGDEIMVVNMDGNHYQAIVGRVKIERRPLLLIEADCEGERIKTFLQNAETIKLLSGDKKPVSVTKVKEGDEVLVHLATKARHFGAEVEERIIEK
jgi:3-dehydroquinate synthase II